MVLSAGTAATEVARSTRKAFQRSIRDEILVGVRKRIVGREDGIKRCVLSFY